MTIRIGDSEYQLAPPFTNRELHLIKQISGARAGELFDALEAHDNDVLVALAHIAIRRAGKAIPTLDQLWDLTPGDIQIDAPDDPADPTPAEPPAGSPATTQP